MPDDRNQRARYLGFVAHEIKNPLSTALWSADLLKRLDPAERAGPRAEKMIDASLRALRRMRRLVDDFFTVERLAQRVLEVRREPTPVRGLLDASIALLAEKDRTEAAGWTYDVPDGLQADCDGELTKRALRAVFEQVMRSGTGPLTIVGQGDDKRCAIWVGRRGEANVAQRVPPPPEDQAGGDPDGGVLGFLLARTVMDVHGGSIDEQDGGLRVSIPEAA